LFIGQVGDVCTSGTMCSAGLFCSGVKSGSGSCKEIAADAPHILSIKLEGAQPTQAWYRAKPGTEIQLTVQASNAASASAVLDNLSGARAASAGIDQLTKSPGGVYTGGFTVTAGMSASLEVTVVAANGDESSLAVKVASTE
jgi:hypothetical protein